LRFNQPHPWNVTPRKAVEIQEYLRSKVIQVNTFERVDKIAGVDISLPKDSDLARAAVIVLKFPTFELLEQQTASVRVEFPYIPGLLAFREAPAILIAMKQLTLLPDLIMVDGQGLAHPRKMGIASHLGLILNLPTIGCGKTRLCGHHESLGREAGSYTYLFDNGEVIGAAVRTKKDTNPVYVSIGHKIDLVTAVRFVLKCCQGYRLPTPIRMAHHLAGCPDEDEPESLGARV